MKFNNILKTFSHAFVITGLLAMALSGLVVVSRAQATSTTPPEQSNPAQPPQLAPVISVDPTSITSIQPDELVTVPLTITNTGDSDLIWSIYDTYENILWSDNFDGYVTGSSMHGQGGWTGWANDPAATAYTSDLFAHSTPNSVDIVATSDLVQEYSGATSGVWEYTAWQYIPTDFSGESYFILLNQYDGGGPATNWSVQVNFVAATNSVVNTGITAGTLPMIRGQWVELRVVIDLSANTTSFFYGGDLLYAATWTEEVSGGGIADIAAVDLFANSATSVYYDDMSLSQSLDVPWLSTDPTSGTTPAGGSSVVDVNLDATGLADGEYLATLYVESNDPVNGLVLVPVTMIVKDEADLSITKSDAPDPVKAGELITYTLSVNNAGPDDASDVMVVDTLSPDVTFVSASTGCTEASGVVTCDVGILAPGAPVEYTIVVQAPLTAGMVANTATVTGDVIDNNLGNNTATTETTVISEPSLFVQYLPLIFK